MSTPRIIAGRFKNKPLTVSATGVRPTASMVRGAMFNMLASYMNLEGKTVADLCCGSGALGLEALSRGASHLWLMDLNQGNAHANIKAFGVAAQTTLVADDATQAALHLPRGAIDLVLLDPPYRQNIARRVLENAAAIGKPGTLWMVETETTAGGAKLAFCGPYSLLKHKQYGETALTLLMQKEPV